MFKRSFLAACFCMIAVPFVGAFEYSVTFRTGDIKLSTDINPKDKTSQMSGSLSVLTFSFMDVDTGLGLEVSPLTWTSSGFYDCKNRFADNNAAAQHDAERKFYWADTIASDNVRCSFLNVGLFWNLLHSVSEHVEISPFVQVNALYPVQPSYFKMDSGLRVSLFTVWDSEFFMSKFLSVELGARVEPNRVSCFTTVGVDLTTVVALFLSSFCSPDLQ